MIVQPRRERRVELELRPAVRLPFNRRGLRVAATASTFVAATASTFVAGDGASSSDASSSDESDSARRLRRTGRRAAAPLTSRRGEATARDIREFEIRSPGTGNRNVADDARREDDARGRRGARGRARAMGFGRGDDARTATTRTGVARAAIVRTTTATRRRRVIFL